MLTLLVAGAPAVAQHPSDSERGAQVDRLVERYRLAAEVPGIAVAVARDGRVVKATGYGRANGELEAPVTPQSLFGLGSISKQFTATAIMQLVEQHRVGLDEPITRYVDSLPAHWAPITIRHLLTHTSGLPEEHWLPSFVEFDRFEHRQLDVLRSIFADSLESPPGTRWAYRNSGYRLLGMVIENVSGESYWSYLERHIFGPIGMRATRSSDPKTWIPHRAKGYGRERGRIVNREPVTESAAFSEGALMSSVLDLVRWDSSLYHPTILTEASLQQMWTPVQLNDGRSWPYGFGWDVAPTNRIRTVSHGGSLPGFRTQFTRFLGKHLTVVVLTNAEWAAPNGLAATIGATYDPALAVPVEPAMAETDPGFGRAVRDLVDGFARGELDRRRLTPAAQNELTDDALQRFTRLLRRSGRIRGLDLVRRDDQGQIIVSQYRLELDGGTLIVSVGADPAGLIAGVDLEPAIPPR